MAAGGAALGVVLPQTELGGAGADVRRFATGVEELGFSHLLAYDHVVGAPAPAGRAPGPYDLGATYHEPLVLLGHLAACTGLGLATCVLVLPQRQTVLVAKQAAEVALLSDGRLRLGVGVGWNRAEHDALGASFTTRGRRLDTQVELLRALWTQELADVGGADGDVEPGRGRVGLSPRPTSPVPVWVGGDSDAAMRRVGRLADGWFPKVSPGPDLDAALAVIAQAAAGVGRDPAAIGMEGRVPWRGDDGEVERGVHAWRAAGATHVSVETLGAGLHGGVEEHLDVLHRLSSRLGS